MNRRQFIVKSIIITSAIISNILPAQANEVIDNKSNITLGITLEPPSLNPTISAASSVGEVMLYNILETLVKINSDGKISPLLAKKWEVSKDLLTYTFYLEPNLKFSNGNVLNSKAIKGNFIKAASENSTNKDKAIFLNIKSIDDSDDNIIKITLKNPNPDFLFYMGQATASIIDLSKIDSENNNNNIPTGSGAYTVKSWTKGSSITLSASPSYRFADKIKIKTATFKFISDPAAQTAAILSGAIDVFTRTGTRGIKPFEKNPKLQTIISNSWSKTVLSINHTNKALKNINVRQAISKALNKQQIIKAAANGYGVEIGSHYVPQAKGYIDTTNINSYDPTGAKELLSKEGYTSQNPLTLKLVLPPTPYARQGADIIISQLANIGIKIKVQQVQWAQWLSNVYSGANDYDLTFISHVEPFDLGNFAKDKYYWNYKNPEFNKLYEQINQTPDNSDRIKLLEKVQTILANDAALIWLYQPQWITVANKKVKGLWQDMPIFVNDLTQMYWVK